MLYLLNKSCLQLNTGTIIAIDFSSIKVSLRTLQVYVPPYSSVKFLKTNILCSFPGAPIGFPLLSYQLTSAGGYPFSPLHEHVKL